MNANETLPELRIEELRHLAMRRYKQNPALSTTDLFDNLIQEASKGQESLASLRVHLNRLGISHYALRIGNSGLGDKLVAGAVGARLSELLGLSYDGLLLPHPHYERVASYFNDPLVLYDALGWSAEQTKAVGSIVLKLPNINWRSINGGSIQAKKFLLEFLNSVTSVSPETAPTLGKQSMLIQPPVAGSGWISILLTDQTGNYLNNQFTLQSGRALRASLRLDIPADADEIHETPEFLLHLRLGDVALLTLDIDTGPGQERKANRSKRMESASKIVRELRTHYGSNIRLTLISDGLDRAIEMLGTPVPERWLPGKAAGLTEAKVEQISRQMRDWLESFCSDFDLTIIGEGQHNFFRSMSAIRRCDMAFSTSGGFLPHSANLLRNDPARPLTLLSINTLPGCLLCSPGVRLLEMPEDSSLAAAIAVKEVGAIIERTGT